MLKSKRLVTVIGKTVKNIAKIRGGGSALPGLVVEHIYPNFAKETLSKLPFGVVVISGTNGKTTTTKMVVELLESQGIKVFTNKTGSNFSRGVIAALLGEININGELDADIAVLELDEAHAVSFVETIPPEHCLLLNVMRDQLDRFGEIDYTANLLRKIAINTKKSVVLNREDLRVASIARSLEKQKVSYFGVDEKIKDQFPNDDELHSQTAKSHTSVNAVVTLLRFTKNTATFSIGGKKLTTNLKVNGAYNILNAAAAIALVISIVGKDINFEKLIKTLSKTEPAFGRGETIIYKDKPIEIVLVKNPAGFRLGLSSFDAGDYMTMIAINDNYADGRDMSWLWDVDFSSLYERGVSQITGTRAYDMALRLRYDEVPVRKVDVNIKKALDNFLESYPKNNKRIYCTYTAMLEIRKALSKITHVEEI